MTIIEASEFLKIRINESSERKEIKIYTKFIGVLTGIENRELSTDQIELFEKELTLLNLAKPTKNNRKYMKKQMNQFVNYLATEHSILLEGHYADLGIKLGLIGGMVMGISLFQESGGSATGMCFGMLIGYLIGKQMDKKATQQNQVLNIA